MRKFNVFFILQVLWISLILTSCEDKYSEAIGKICAGCSKKPIQKSDLILVTNKNGESNVFSKKRMTFLLSNWYPAIYDEGVIYDDITFKVEGVEVVCTEKEYDMLSDQYLLDQTGVSSANTNDKENELSDNGLTLLRNVYESNENGFKTYLKFNDIEGCNGYCGLLTLSNSLSSCRYIYSYEFSENILDANFFKSDCGASSNNQTFRYDEKTNTLSCYINGQLFTFKSIFE